DVIVPETTAYPVVAVTKRTFSDEELLTLIKRFAGSNNELYSKWDLTKQEWADKQIKFKQADPDEKLAPDYLDYLQGKYDEAEEEVKNPLVDISDLSTEQSSSVFVKQDNNTVALFKLFRNENYFAYLRDMFLEQAPASVYKDSDFDAANETIEQFRWRQSKDPEISQEEAYAQALKYIDELKIDLELYKAETCTFLVDVVDKSVGWKFTFTRKISNAQVQYELRGFNIDKDAMPSYGAPWNEEVCAIGIDKNGLCFLESSGASQISRVVIDTTELEQFEIIQQRITNQLNYIYGAANRGNGIGLDIKVTEIKLGTSLISVKDESDIGIYIPTWYVDYYIKWSDAEDSEGNGELNTIIFNAIDGSYIEPRVTNEKLMGIMKES
ncbi:MAG: DUF6034 family protein, partial [Clostridiaceae bacterium]|nr:DUF6034 family protein [Clostridiaceae bacterium]